MTPELVVFAAAFLVLLPFCLAIGHVALVRLEDSTVQAGDLRIITRALPVSRLMDGELEILSGEDEGVVRAVREELEA